MFKVQNKLWEQQQQEEQRRRREVVKEKRGVIAAGEGRGSWGGNVAKRAAVCGVFKVVAAVN